MDPKAPKSSALRFVPTSVVLAKPPQVGGEKQDDKPLQAAGEKQDGKPLQAAGEKQEDKPLQAAGEKQRNQSDLPDLLGKLKVAASSSKNQNRTVAEKDMKQIPSVALESRSPTTMYRITWISASGKINIVPTTDHDYLKLMDVCMDAEDLNSLTQIPTKGTYVMAKNDTRNKQYYRARVSDVRNELVTVVFPDLGTAKTLKYVELKPAVEEAFQHPLLGYDGWLINAKENTDLILREDFKRFASIVVGRLVALKNISHNEQGDRELDLHDARTADSISDHFNKLKAWEWERFVGSSLQFRDFEVIERGKWGGREANLDCAEVLCFSNGEVIGAKFVRLAEAESGTMFLYPITYSPYQADMQVLQLQSQRYCERVKETLYYPALNDVFLYGDGKTIHRCHRVSESFISSIDTGKIFQLPGERDLPKFVRRMPPEFMRVPIGIFESYIPAGYNMAEIVSNKELNMLVKFKGLSEDSGIYSLEILGAS